MTPRELSGWVPAEKHLHYDADGHMTGWTVVEREPRIDDADRAALLGLARFEREVCRCGYHPSIADDESNVFQPETRRCPVCAGEAVWGRIEGDRDRQWSEAHKDADPQAPRPSDGRHWFMRWNRESVSPARATPPPGN